MEIPIGDGQVSAGTKIEAKMLGQELAIKNTDKILEIGTGSGYMAALFGSTRRTRRYC